jgi:molecular chaperone GrpE
MNLKAGELVTGLEKADPDAADQATTESIAPSTDPLVQLEADLKAARAEAAEWQDRFLRKAAELENYRKRTEKEKADLMTLAKNSVLIEFLPLADSCERALKNFESDQAPPAALRPYREGVELLYKQVLDALSRAGVVPMETEGKPFDPRFHDALSREETSEHPDNTVIREVRRGYLYKDRLLRPAQVIVAVRPPARD